MTTVNVWIVIGARRWARLMVTELCRLLSPEIKIYLLGNPEDLDLQCWLLNSGLAGRVKVVFSAPPCPKHSTGVAIVVNSAYLHKQSVTNALVAGYHVVCEKPVTFSKADTLGLMETANNLGLRIFSTNTFLFASYLNTFREDWLTGHSFKFVNISWADPINECRHGELKNYDSGVPLIFDVLPHIANILLATLGSFTVESSVVQVRSGGSEVLIDYRLGDQDVRITLKRNSRHRKRTLVFSNAGRKVELDFSTEPGLVSVNNNALCCVDPTWKNNPKPIAAMLRSVMTFFEAEEEDPRLSVSTSVLGNDLIDSVVDSYVSQQVLLLSSHEGVTNANISRVDLAYAEKEAKSLSQRVKPFINERSPLCKLATVGEQLKL